MKNIVLLAGIGIGVTATAIALLFVLEPDTILKSGESGPNLSDQYKQSMKTEMVAEGLSFPTSMEFVDNENILVLEKDHGTVRLVSSWNRTLEKEPVLKLNVENEAECGLLGVAILRDNNVRNKEYSINNDNNDSTNIGFVNNESSPIVYLYYTERSEFENENENERQRFPRNKVYSYE
jgi:hypothetical protein